MISPLNVVVCDRNTGILRSSSQKFVAKRRTELSGQCQINFGFIYKISLPQILSTKLVNIFNNSRILFSKDFYYFKNIDFSYSCSCLRILCNLCFISLYLNFFSITKKSRNLMEVIMHLQLTSLGSTW